jgi:hypothetical protein
MGTSDPLTIANQSMPIGAELGDKKDTELNAKGLNDLARGNLLKLNPVLGT